MQVKSYQAPNFVGGHPPVMRRQVLASTGAELELAAGVVLGVVSATDKAVVLAPAAEDGSQQAAAILVEDVTVPAAGDAVANVYVHGEFRRAGLGWPAGATTEQVDAAVKELAASGLYVK
ncbi:head decoration protein [Desulfocurvus sp. DL9XJH121]